MTLQEYQVALHALYRGDGSTPSDNTTDWNQREALLAAAINVWDNQGFLWNELWTNVAAAEGVGTTVLASTTSYNMPTDFRFLGSFVRTTSASGDHTFYTIYKPEDAQPYLNTTTKGCYVTGNKSTGYDLNFMEQPTVGETINYPYYKEATNPTSASDVIEMSDPYFAVYFVLGKLHEQEGAGDRARAAYSIADSKLKYMKTRNMMMTHDQSMSGKDMLVYGGFGK